MYSEEKLGVKNALSCSTHVILEKECQGWEGLKCRGGDVCGGEIIKAKKSKWKRDGDGDIRKG